MKYLLEEIGKKILGERTKNKLTQEALGKKIGVTGKQISNYENGKLVPPMDILLEMCAVFNCELGYLLGERSYAHGTALDTQIADVYGISKDSLNNIHIITGREIKHMSFGDQSEEYRSAMNAFLSSEYFPSLIDALSTLDNLYREYHSAFSNLRTEIGEDRYQAAYNHYNDDWDYEHDPDAPALSEEEAQDMIRFNEAIDKQIELGYDIKIARYEVREVFEALIVRLYPR